MEQQHRKLKSLTLGLRSLIEIANRPDLSPKSLLSALETRPELVRWIVYTVNSERFSLAVPATSIRHAMVLVGHNTFRQLVVVAATMHLTL